MYKLEVNHSQLSDLFQVTPQALSKYVRLGLTPTVRGGGGKASKYDVSLAIRWLIQWEVGKVLKRSGVDGADEIDGEYEEARLRRAQADERELKVEQVRGYLIHREEAIRAWSAIVVAARSRFLGLPAKLQSRYPDMPREARDELEQLVREILEELSSHDPISTDDGGPEDDPDLEAAA